MKRIIALVVLASPLFLAQAEDKKKDEDLARVVILNFINTDKSQSHEWVVKSLPDAIYKSMQEKFEFVRTEQAKAQGVADQEKKTRDGYSLKSAGRIAKKTDSDIVIYGNFRLNKTKDQLILHATVYNATGKKVIGTVSKNSTLDQKVFTNIDVIAQGIVDHIYKFALQSEERAKQKAIDEKIRLLVPTYETEAERKTAVKELATLKKDLSTKYSGRYLTVFEFYKERKIVKKEQDQVNGYAKARDQKKIIAWLKTKKIEDAFIVLVSKKKVNITPVVKGTTKKKVAYDVGAPPAKRQAAVAVASKEAQIKTKEEAEKEKKVNLTKSLVESRPPFLAHLGFGTAIPLSKPGERLKSGFGISGDARYGPIYNHFYPMARLGFFSYDGSSTTVTKMSQLELLAGLTYPLTVLTPKLLVSPFAAGGLSLGSVKTDTDTVSYGVPTFQAGVTFDYSIIANVSVSASLVSSYLLDSTTSMPTIGFVLGAGYSR